MHVYACIYVYTHTQEGSHECILCTCIHVDLDVRGQVYVRMCARVCECVYLRMCVFMPVYVIA